MRPSWVKGTTVSRTVAPDEVRGTLELRFGEVGALFLAEVNGDREFRREELASDPRPILPPCERGNESSSSSSENVE